MMRAAASTDQGKFETLSDKEIFGRARAGDERAVRTLVQRHNRLLFRVARGVLRDDTEAEDAVQETYIRALTGPHPFRGEASLSTWLARIARNEALGKLRRRRAATDLSELDSGDAENGGSLIMFPTTTLVSPESDAGRGEMRRMLAREIDGLPDPFRLVFILRDVEGLSTAETAACLSLRPETVKTRLHRARRQIRKAIETRLTADFTGLFPFDGERCADMADRVVARLRETRRRDG